MPTRTECPIEIPEGTTFRYRTQLRKEDGTPLVGAQLQTLTLTLYALDLLQTIINGVLDLNILNANLGTVDAGGILIVTLRPADTVIIDGNLPTEQRIMLIEGTYADGKATRHEVALTVRNLTLVP
jgi:hypothetical protein